MLFIFDMGGVVTNTFKFDRMYAKLGLTGDQFYSICSFGGRNIKHQLDVGRISTNEFWRLFNDNARSLGMNVPEVHNDLFGMYFHPTLDEGTVDVIRRLKAAGHRVICGTNTIDSHFESHMTRGDYAFFDQTYASNRIGEAKPDQAFFRVILEAEECRPEDAFFTDDRLENIEAAAACGIHAVQFITAEGLAEAWKSYLV